MGEHNMATFNRWMEAAGIPDAERETLRAAYMKGGVEAEEAVQKVRRKLTAVPMTKPGTIKNIA